MSIKEPVVGGWSGVGVITQISPIILPYSFHDVMEYIRPFPENTAIKIWGLVKAIEATEKCVYTCQFVCLS